MPLDNPRGGFGLSAEYQCSALPWVSSSVATSTAQEIHFNYITRFISLTNLDSTNSIYLGFSQNGVNGVVTNNYATIPKGATLTLEWRVTKIWIKAPTGTPAYSLAAGLTTIPAGVMPLLSGAGPDGSNWAGVG
jgi:hypothetical protein